MKKIKQLLGKIGLKILGWKIQLEGDENTLNRCILVVAPHTTNFEYFLGYMTYWQLDKPLRVIIKDAHTKAWYGGIVKALGGIGIDRSKKNHLIDIISELYKKEDFSLVVTPEGTRSRVNKWRLGFYHMALKSNVPIVLAAGDFGTKTIRIGKKISVEDLQTRSLESIMLEIQEYYKDITQKYPETWNPQIF